MSIFLIRHGETDSNARRVIQTPDAALSKRGQQQAERLAFRLSEEGVVAILSSDLARASMTAEWLAASTRAHVTHNSLLQERNFGDLRGRAYDDVGIDIFAADYAPPGGETWEMFRSRVVMAWELIQAAAAGLSGHLAVVTHGFVCRVLAEDHLSLPAECSLPPGWANTALTVVDAEPPWRVRLMNCTAHLDTATGLTGIMV